MMEFTSLTANLWLLSELQHPAPNPGRLKPIGFHDAAAEYSVCLSLKFAQFTHTHTHRLAHCAVLCSTSVRPYHHMAIVVPGDSSCFIRNQQDII